MVTACVHALLHCFPAAVKNAYCCPAAALPAVYLRLTHPLRRSAAQSLGIEPINLLLDASQSTPTPAPAATGISGVLSDAGNLVNQTVSGVRDNLQSAAAGLNMTVSQVSLAQHTLLHVAIPFPPQHPKCQ